MRDAAIDAFWARYVRRAGDYPRPARDVARVCAQLASPLPAAFVALLTRGGVAGVDAPELSVAAVGDWLAHALERHAVLRAVADACGNPTLATLVPFGESPQGFEVALDLAADGAVVWLDPQRYDNPGDAIVATVAPSIDAYVQAQLAGAPHAASQH